MSLQMVRTVILKLHKPGKTKQKIIDRALLNYNTALRFLFNKACRNLAELEERFHGKDGRGNMLALSKWIDGDLSLELNRFGVQPFKDSLKLEFAAGMANYLRLENARPGAAFSGLRNREEDGKNGMGSSIYFCRYDTKRSYCLLYDRIKDRYYAKLYLLNSADARKAPVRSLSGEGLAYIHKDGGSMEKSMRKEAYIIMPLSFGRWQEQILKEAAQTPERLKTARLFKKKNEYYLSLSIAMGGEETIRTAAFMGVSRGLKNKLNYTVVNHSGEILSSGPISSPNEYRSIPGICTNELHGAANFIAGTAVRCKAQVIVQNLAEKGDKLGWAENGQEQYQPAYKRSDYNRLTRLLDYKLLWRGLPPPIKVSSTDIFYRCRNCGTNSQKNRFSKELFICTRCGTAMDIDELGSLNLAEKLISYGSSKVKIKVVKADGGVFFRNEILELNCFISHEENPLGRLKKEIQKIIDGAESMAGKYGGKPHSRKMSLIKKLEHAGDFMRLLEYIE